jgi:hypothetical protein
MYRCRIGHSQKGWITGEIALCWIQEFDHRTSEKAAGRARLLLLDGHASHLTRAFLEYARGASIIILCYPSHSTHIYQGLDVVCFGPFKRYWSARRDEYERETGLIVQKTNFMHVMSDAYVRAFTPHNIQLAFRKTGVVPFDPTAISTKSLSIAIETSTQESLPIQQPSPIRAIVNSSLQPMSASHGSSHELVDEDAVDTICKALASTPYSFLLDPSPIPIEHKELPTLAYPRIEPLSTATRALLTYTPRTEQEARLVWALQEFAERNALHDKAARSTSAIAILQGLYCARLKAQLFSSNEPKEKDSGRLMADGLPVVLTSDEFLAQVASRDEQRDNETRLKEARKKARIEQKEAMALWKKEDRARIEKNKADARRYKFELEQWKAERDRARRQGEKPKSSKPIKPARQPPIPRPVRREVRFTLSDSDSSPSVLAAEEQSDDSDSD